MYIVKNIKKYLFISRNFYYLSLINNYIDNYCKKYILEICNIIIYIR